MPDELQASGSSPPLRTLILLLMDEKKKNLLFPPSHRVLHWCTRAVATLLPNTQRSPDTPTATGDTNPVLKGKKNHRVTRPNSESPEQRGSPSPAPQAAGPQQPPRPGPGLGEGKRPESLGAALPLPQGGQLRGLHQGRAPAPFVPPQKGPPPAPGGSAPARRRGGGGPLVPARGLLPAAHRPSPHGGPSPLPGGGERQGLCPSADPAPDAPACGRGTRTGEGPLPLPPSALSRRAQRAASPPQLPPAVPPYPSGFPSRVRPVTCWLRGMSAAIFLPLIRAAAGAGGRRGERRREAARPRLAPRGPGLWRAGGGRGLLGRRRRRPGVGWAAEETRNKAGEVYLSPAAVPHPAVPSCGSSAPASRSRSAASQGSPRAGLGVTCPRYGRRRCRGHCSCPEEYSSR